MDLLRLAGGIGGALILGLLFFFLMAGYGGNNCDLQGTCECFCCHMFGSRGYESCASFGGLLGLAAGAVSGYLTVQIIRK